MFKRYFLFFGVNILIMITISLVMNILGIGSYMTAAGINYQSLMIFCLLWGMGGSFISLKMSKWMAKKFMGVQIITATGPHGELVRLVHGFAKRAGLETMPEVGIFDSPDVNAFATGPSRNNSLVALSTGLLQQVGSDGVEGVIGHEVAHIANGDMVTMTLIQGVMNAFVMFFARIAAFAVSQAMRGDDEEGEGLGFFAHIMVVMLFEVLFGILASIVVNWFSRYREYRADAGGASLAGKEKMITALEAILNSQPLLPAGKAGGQEKSFRALGINSKKSWMALFSTHPPLEQRIEQLRKLSR
ncbi:MAG: protease HtpX [Bdellovibrionales bacterium]|jgi:heat shock protein HtpX|nr:protease HtpX [Bdellovibrionales bacterium]MBT3527296.1 protease HtpX [Bdellovibrionales bacterium]MBT7669061.1 protease HtpX [Bdellovibrionales bacterium]MBT7766770.1 protease HtpX [Bdellovibrionales bacterium]